MSFDRPDAKFLLCRPLGGLNDNLVQIELCWRYAETYGRTLVIDTQDRSKGLLLPFSECFTTVCQKDQVVLNPHSELLSFLDGLSAYPGEVAGRIGSYSSSFDREKNNYVDTVTGAMLSLPRDTRKKYRLPDGL